MAVLGRTAERADGFARPVTAAGSLYLDAVVRAGGAPVVVPPFGDGENHSSVFAPVLASVLARCSALVATGGADVNPRRYGEDPHPSVYGVDDELDEFEIAALGLALDLDLPVLAICRGMQVLNVALGGTLIQHLDNTAEHKGLVHDVSLQAGSRCADTVGATSCAAYSAHHQALGSIASDLAAVGWSSDGVVEAVEHRTARWVVGVQWHPEITAASDARQQSLFDELVRRA